MNVLFYFAMGWAALIVGHKYLKPSIEGIMKPDPSRKTAAVLIDDGKDYVPTSRPILFGHHWMSIAGTSPIIAAIVGLAWGWVPAFLWMVLGVTFIGGVHDYFVTMISTRNQGRSMGEMLYERIGKYSGKLSSVLLAFGGILVFAIFLFVISGTLAATPTAVVPSFSLLIIAVATGFMLRRGVPLAIASLIAAALIVVGVVIGLQIPISLPMEVWIWVFGIYTLIAIATPVWVLLQPRDYLDSFVLVVALILGILGLIFARPAIQYPAFISWIDPVANRPLWPMLFATISCGAASGWHSLIAAGTTSKQLKSEKDGFLIAYGGMQSETVMALVAGALIITSVSLGDFSSVLANPGAAFAAALGSATTHLGFSAELGATIGALALSALTLTTMDSFARTGRYVLQELAKGTPLEKPIPSSIFVFVCGMFLYFSVPFLQLWAGLVLAGLLALVFPLSILLTEKIRLQEKMDFSFKIHVIAPLIFIYVTSYGALFYQLNNFVRAGGWVSAAMVLFLMVLGAVIAVESYGVVNKPLVTDTAGAVEK